MYLFAKLNWANLPEWTIITTSTVACMWSGSGIMPTKFMAFVIIFRLFSSSVVRWHRATLSSSSFVASCYCSRTCNHHLCLFVLCRLICCVLCEPMSLDVTATAIGLVKWATTRPPCHTSHWLSHHAFCQLDLPPAVLRLSTSISSNLQRCLVWCNRHISKERAFILFCSVLLLSSSAHHATCNLMKSTEAKRIAECLVSNLTRPSRVLQTHYCLWLSPIYCSPPHFCSVYFMCISPSTTRTIIVWHHLITSPTY